MPKSLPAWIVVDLYPRTSVGLVTLLQGQGDIAKWTPAACIEEVRFGGLKRIGSNFHLIVSPPLLRRGLQGAAIAILAFYVYRLRGRDVRSLLRVVSPVHYHQDRRVRRRRRGCR